MLKVTLLVINTYFPPNPITVLVYCKTQKPLALCGFTNLFLKDFPHI